MNCFLINHGLHGLTQIKKINKKSVGIHKIRENPCLLFPILCGFLFILFSHSLGAMNWPCEGAVLIRNFGSNDNGRPVLGMVFSGDTEVLAAESGEIIFTRNSRDNVSRLPSPLGSWTAIDHGDGLISIYSRLAENSQTADGSSMPSLVEKQQPIAAAGISGWSSNTGFYFMVYDRWERRWINPALIITPRQETSRPLIHSVELRNQQGAAVHSRNITQGRYSIHVNAAGVPAGLPAAGSAAARTTQGIQLAPQRIVCLVDGAEAGTLNFESVSARDGVLMVHRNGLVPARQVYINYPAFEAAEVFLNRGQINLEIIVYDITGNSRSLINRLIVN